MKTPPKYCSQRCHGAAIKGTGHGIVPNHRVVCESCGRKRMVYRAPSASPPRFCSIRCIGLAQRGENNPSYTGGTHLLANGYRVVLRPDDPEADTRGYVYEHRLVARDVVGRALLPREVVHHINGIKTDNAPSNLMVFASQSEHSRHHAASR